LALWPENQGDDMWEVLAECILSDKEVEADAGHTVSLDAALKLLEGEKNEEKVLGATLVLRHHNKLLLDARGVCERSRLRTAVGGTSFLCRLLQSSLHLQRLALGLLTVLLAGTDTEAQEAAEELMEVVPYLVRACNPSQTDAKVEEWSHEEICEALAVLKRLLDLLSPIKDSSSILVQGSLQVLALLLPSNALASFLPKEEVAKCALAISEVLLQQELPARTGDKDLPVLLEAIILEPSYHGTLCQSAALQLFSTSLQSRSSSSIRLDEIITCSLKSGAMAHRALLQLVAGLLPVHGLSLCSGKPSLTRLKPLLVLASGELRMALEGYGSKEGLVAACMLLEEAIVALGKEAEILESSGNLEEVSECLREIHRALQDIFDYCADLPVTSQAPEELAIVARVVAAFQLEDPRQFTSEFQHAIEAFCQLEPSEFKVLLPCLQELQDWHFTKAFAKVLEVAHWGLECSDSQRMEAWRQCAMMVAEVALDAAVYLPEVSLPPLDDPEVTGHRLAASAEFALSCSLLNGVRLPRPVPAADAKHEGVRRLCKWSRRLWLTGRQLVGTSNGDCNGEPSVAREQIAVTGQWQLWELTLLCASLLTSVPWETVLALWPENQGDDMWEVLAECILSDKEVEASTGRLAVRLAGFCLDRHEAWPQALVRVAHRRSKLGVGKATVSKSIERLLKNLSDDDEWELADRAAFKAVQGFLDASANMTPTLVEAEKACLETSGYATTVLDGMD